jgi:hypothetical protein
LNSSSAPATYYTWGWWKSIGQEHEAGEHIVVLFTDIRLGGTMEPINELLAGAALGTRPRHHWPLNRMRVRLRLRARHGGCDRITVKIAVI